MTASYKPVFHMPVIGPPPDNYGGTSATYYSALNVTVSAVQLSVRQGAEIFVSDTAQATIYAICGGIVSFFPPNAIIPSPDNQVAPPGGALVLKAWASDFQAQKQTFPPGAEAATTYIYFNIEQIDAHIQTAVETLKLPALTKFWQQQQTTPPPADIEQLRDHYEAGVMLGLAWIFIDGGTPLGTAIKVADNDPSQGATFHLQQLSGGNPSTYLSAASTIRAVPQSDTTPPVGRWSGHPLLGAVANLPLPAEFHLKFTTWNQVLKNYSPIANATVSVIQTGTSGDSAIVAGQTDTSGIVHLVHPDISQFPPGQRKLYFEIDLQTSQLYFDNDAGALTNFPMQFWSTQGWQSADGAWLGFYDEFSGSCVGAAAAPAEFRVGLDFHVHFQRKDSITGNYVQFPRYSHIKVYTLADKSDAVDFMTDSTGAVEGVWYDIQDPVADDVTFEVQYASIRLQGGTVSRRAYFSFLSPLDSTDRSFGYPILGLPCLTKTGASIFAGVVVNNAWKSDAVYILQCVEEVVALVTYLTNPPFEPIWNDEIGNPIGPGLKLTFKLVPPSLNVPFSSPGREVKYYRGSWTSTVPAIDRDCTVFHELGHALHRLTTIKNQDIVNSSSNPGPASHYTRSLSNPYFAFQEGWAEFFAALFAGPEAIFRLFPDPIHPEFLNPTFSWSDPFSGFDPNDPFNFSIIANLDYVFQFEPIQGIPVRKPFGSPADQNGRLVEGAFATALYMIVNSHVAQHSTSSPVSLARTSGDCDVVAANAWLTESGVCDRFRQMVWDPFMSLAGPAKLNTTDDFVKAVEEGNPDDWPGLKVTFNKLHIAVDEPDVLGLMLNSAPLTNLQTLYAYPNVQVDGTGFVDGMTVAFKDGPNNLPAGNVDVKSDVLAYVTIPPLAPGSYGIVITTAWGEKTVPNLITVAN